MPRKGGKPAGPSSPRASAGLSAGVDFGGTKVEVALVDREGRVRSAHRHPSSEGRTPSRAVRLIANCLEECQAGAGRDVRSLGVGIAAQVDSEGTVLHAPNLGWTHVPFARSLERAVGVPVHVANDVQAITFGEWQFGAGRGVEELLCVFVGTGVGGGIVSHGALLRGAGGSAGEIGHLSIEINGRRCHCGRRGCLEAYAGGWGIAARAREAAREHPLASRTLRTLAGSAGAISASTVSDAFHSGDPLASKLVRETALYLGAGLASATNLLSPRRIILGGGVLDGIPELLEAVRPVVRRRALSSATRPLRIVPARLGTVAGVIGASALARTLLEST
jgi:glucokinase